MPIRDIAAKNKSLDNDYGTTRGPNAPASCQVALFTDNPTTTGTELPSTNGYARVTLPSNDWPAASGGAKTTPVTFPAPTGAWATVKYWGLYDTVSATWWDYAPLANSLTVTGAGSGPVIALTVLYDNL